MSGTTTTAEYRRLLQQAYLSLAALESDLNASHRAVTEPIAIVGAGCRYPGGVDGPETFWQRLQDGFDAINEVPADRGWDLDCYYDPDPETPGTMYTRCGGYLEGVDRFDAMFFGITPREAEAMDPQHRLLLEVAWEALEHAGQSPEKLAGSNTGVFTGIICHDYLNLLLQGNPANIHTHELTGNLTSIAPGRLAYLLGLRGPTISIDTACSSSLVAIHLACQSLRVGECDMALAGGVNLILIPEANVLLSKMRVLAPDGRCKTFDERADGYGRAEGCGLVVLKRLSDALADHDTILALIRGSAVNQDGARGGLTVPNGTAQEAVIKQALANAGIEPGQIGYIEAHGTGTELGDPIEVEALGRVFGGNHHEDRPLVVGTVKANIGHAEAAAGVAGVIKTALSVCYGEIPPHPTLVN